ncbi:MAG: primosomal protein N' [Eubacteriales bacterium]|nr:primosomal protein N' [Eubacteriales bacterium]
MIYADIIIDISHERLDRSFQYKVPETLEKRIRIGDVVSIPFGAGNRMRKGYVTGLSEEPRVEESRMKEIAALGELEETTESRLIALAAWMRENYGATMIQALKTVLPIQDKVRAKETRHLVLSISKEEASRLLQELEGTRFKARARLLRALLEKGRLPLPQARELGASSRVLEYFQERGVLSVEIGEVFRTPIEGRDIPRMERPPLSPDQKRAVEQIRREWRGETPRPVLLQGVTGSGKTRVYIELIQEVLREGKQAIVLIPEISLTYQTVRRFYGCFGDCVSVLNSRLSKGERYDQFRRAKQGDVQVMVGPRSALFTPFSQLGLIIIDEEHEPTYKSENSPRYHARETAVKRAGLEGAKVLLGSATPSLEAYSRAMAGEYALVELTARYEERPLPRVDVVDLRQELKKGNRSILSGELKDALEDCLKKGQQAMLFLNRRGYAGFVSCRSCGQVMKCPHCDVSLSEHHGNRLVCHYCGYERIKPRACPACGSPYIGGFKAGTQQIEDVVLAGFPRARVLRMDHDTTRAKGSYERILAAFAAGEADILIGTQMIVKGHDFPHVTLVGIIAADLSLNAEDYRCGERTFQLLTQAVGRSGRGRLPGRAVIQSYSPEHYSIQAAARQDYQAFYQEEMSYRRLMDYPPAAHLMAVLGFGEDEEVLTQAMYYLSMYGEKLCAGEVRMIGPAAASVGKVRDVYRRVLYFKHPDHRVLVALKDRLERYMEINSGFRKLYIQFDIS